MDNARLILVLKLVVLATWLAAATSFLLPAETTFARTGRLLFGLLTIVHAIECAFFYSTLRRTGRPILLELANTMLFGVIHFTEAKAIAGEREAR